jgi:hypothetical protein
MYSVCCYALLNEIRVKHPIEKKVSSLWFVEGLGSILLMVDPLPKFVITLADRDLHESPMS